MTLCDFALVAMLVVWCAAWWWLYRVTMRRFDESELEEDLR